MKPIRFASPALRPSTQAWLPASMSFLRFAGKVRWQVAARHAQAENNNALVKRITDLTCTFAAADEIKKSFIRRIHPEPREVRTQSTDLMLRLRNFSSYHKPRHPPPSCRPHSPQ